jgi:hypothetical protein
LLEHATLRLQHVVLHLLELLRIHAIVATSTCI